MVRLPLFDVMRPNVEEVMLLLGAPRFGWFSASYISARNCSRMRSRIGCHRLITVSKPKVPGLRRFGSVRESVPNEYCPGLVKALVLNHSFILWPLERLMFPERTA